MEVKFNPNAQFPQQQSRMKKPGMAGMGALSFADRLKTTAEARKPNFAAMSPEAVFETALADRDAPDLQMLDDFLEWKISQL